MIGIRVEDREKREEIWRKKKALKGRKERILEDWSWEQRRMMWDLENIARREEGKGKKVRVEYGRIRIGEQWWKWDEHNVVLRNGGGKEWREEQEKDIIRGEKRGG